jgi:hypothetical protein
MAAGVVALSFVVQALVWSHSAVVAEGAIECPALAGFVQILGSDAADTLTGTAGNDIICGGSGSDLINGGDGNDIVYAGDGNDHVLGGNGDDDLRGGEGDDQLLGENGKDVVLGEGGNDSINGDNGADRIWGGSGDDVVSSGSGDDFVDLGDGADRAVDTANGSDVVNGGEGVDAADAGRGIDSCVGVEQPTGCEDALGTADPDADGISSQLEVRFGSDPTLTDTDGDGLSDRFEITFGGPLHDARYPDSDVNGLPDGLEDVDDDGLTAALEQAAGTDPLDADEDRDTLLDPRELELGTSPISADTDQDGLFDQVEGAVGTDPLVADTDGDGLLDGAETVVVDYATAGVELEMIGTGNLAVGVSVLPVAQQLSTAQVGVAYDIDLDETNGAGLETAELRLTYDPTVVADPSALAVFWFDEVNGVWTPAEQFSSQVVDPATNTVTATVNHFSLYALFNRLLWAQTWTGGEECESGGGGGTTTAVDVALVIDSSGSMSWNDPSGLRKSAAKSFVDALGAEDSASVVDFDGSARVYSELTADKAALRSAIDRIDSSGGTNIGAGVSVGLDTLSRGPADSLDAEYMVLLTDGDGSYSTTFTQRAINDDVVIFTIGLGDSVNSSLLSSIATATGGRYFAAADAADLQDVFDEIGDETGQGDVDGDGLSNCEEAEGWRDGAGNRYTSDPNDADTDDDLLTDGEEAGAAYNPGPRDDAAIVTYRRTTSDPRKLNSDARNNDGSPNPNDDIFADYEETEEIGSNALRTDTDGDGLGDFPEWYEGISPLTRDTDGDGFDDYYEQFGLYQSDPERAILLDLDPAVFDRTDDFGTFTRLYWKGFGCGEILDACPGVSEEDTASIPYLIGSIASGFGGPIPDARDFLASVARLDIIGAGINVIGLIPVAGDLTQATRRVTRTVDRLSDLPVSRVAALIRKLDDLPIRRSWRDALIDVASGGALTALRQGGMSDTALVLFIRKGGDLKGLRRGLDNASDVRRAGPMVTSSKQAEQVLRTQPGFQATGKRFAVPDGVPNTKSSRVVDAWNATTGTALEAKSGFQCLTCTYRLPSGRVVTIDLTKQINADVALRAADEFQRVEWHFFANANGVIASDPKLFDALRDAGIPYVLHLP